MNVQIKKRFTDAVMFECKAPEGLSSGLELRHAMEKAVTAGANLAGANLDGAYLDGAYLDGAYLDGANLDGAYLAGANLAGANLDGAYLDGANLAGANLAGANLDGAYLAGAYLAGANLAGANLDGANLAGANLAGANLDGAYLAGANLAGAVKLLGKRPIFQVGPIGSRCAYFTAYITDKGLRFDAGCQRQITREKFEARLAEHHGDNEHAKQYRAALDLIDLHAEIWTPKDSE